MKTKDSSFIPSLIIDILHQRGIKGYEKVSEFLDPGISCLSDPFSIIEMHRACEIIEDAIYSKKKVFLYADGDVDGIAGAAIFSRMFESLNVSFDIKLTHRLEEYEIEPTFIDRIRRLGYELLVTIDTGTTSTKLIEYCENNKFPLIIFDHHRGYVRDDLKFVTVVNPSLDRGDRDFEFLTASGVALKLVQSLRGLLSFFPEEIFLPCVELAAIGTLGDYGLLIGDNRIIVKAGLDCFAYTGIFGFEEFRKYFYIPKKYKEIETVTHYLNPKLNTPGRFGKPELTLKILTAGRNENLQPVFEEIEALEKEKQNVLRKMTGAIAKAKLESPPFLIFEGIPASFSGTFAARISERFQLPSLVAIKNGDLIQGSARGFDKTDLYEFFDGCRDIFLTFGGHRNAVGFKIKSDFLKDLKGAWGRLKLQNYSGRGLTDKARIDFEALTISVMRALELLKPFGPGNPPVVFTSFPVGCLKITRYEANKTIAWVKQGDKMLEAHFPRKFRMPSRSLSITYTPVVRKSGDFYAVWLNIKDYSEIF
ncbi:MAG: DHH family phosphoesterase [Candidatus Omnitrophica bacterium]|nr:DHH family phosphoesterase [Candidatus Omnitrophota bacterium]